MSAAPQFHLGIAASSLDGRNRAGVTIRIELADLLDVAKIIQEVEPVTGHLTPPTENTMIQQWAK